MSKETGGSAFPCTNLIGSSDGMTLRDYFAAKAMAAMISTINNDQDYYRYDTMACNEGITVSEWFAKRAYHQADAMIEARNK